MIVLDQTDRPRPTAFVKRSFALAALIALGLAAAWSAYTWYRSLPLRELPQIDLAGVDPAVETAIESARSGVLASPRQGAAWGELGQVLEAHHLHQEAQLCLAQAMRFDRHEFLWPYLRGDLLNASDPSEAERCFRIAARLRPKLALPRLRLAERFLEQRRFDDAETEFQAAIRIEPRSARALFGLGQLAFYRGDFSEAARCAEQSFAFDPGHRKTVELRQRVAHRLKDKASVERLQILLDSMPARELNWDDPYYENITQRSRSPGRLAATGTDLVEQGRLPEAVSAFEELVAADPANPQSHGLLAITLIKQREYARAAQILDAGLARHPQLAELHFHRGVAHFFMEQWAAAASEFKRAIELKPDFRDARYNLAQTLAKLDDRKQAIAEFREAIKIRPDVAASYAALGKLLNESGDRDAARAVLEAAAKLKPHDAAIKQSLKSPRNDEAK